jgi:purine-binding chemotaxis protein CheW
VVSGDRGCCFRLSLMSIATYMLVFVIEDIRLAVDLDQVERVVRAATLKLIPGAPSYVLGLLNLNGSPVPVVSLRARLNLPEREIEISDEIIILKRQEILLGLLVDEVENVTGVKDILPLAQAAQLTHLSGALKLEDDIVLVQDIDMLLTSSEEVSLATLANRSSLE